MRIRSAGLFTLFLCMTSIIQVQQRPQYTQYIFNGFLINPAVVGIERYIDIKLGSRSQPELFLRFQHWVMHTLANGGHEALLGFLLNDRYKVYAHK